MSVRRPMLLPLVPLYAAALRLKARLGTGSAKRLRQPVISIGSLSAGGAGKTPVVTALAELLGRNGYLVDVLSRGYGRASAAAARVDAEGEAAQYGDEPLLLARTLGISVYVAADRYAAGVLAEATDRDRRMHLLDDGFQHRRLARAFDIVLLTREDVADALLPAGNLREPLSQLGAAGVVVLREEEAQVLRPCVTRLARPEIPVWVIRRRLTIECETALSRPLVFCGIARPEGFFSMVRTGGVALAGTVEFRDHHRYRERDIERLLHQAQRSAADGFVTTEKDAVKLSATMRARLEAAGPLAFARLTVEFQNEDEVVAAVVAAAWPGDLPSLA